MYSKAQTAPLDAYAGTMRGTPPSADAGKGSPAATPELLPSARPCSEPSPGTRGRWRCRRGTLGAPWSKRGRWSPSAAAEEVGFVLRGQMREGVVNKVDQTDHARDPLSTVLPHAPRHAVNFVRQGVREKTPWRKVWGWTVHLYCIFGRYCFRRASWAQFDRRAGAKCGLVPTRACVVLESNGGEMLPPGFKIRWARGCTPGSSFEN